MANVNAIEDTKLEDFDIEKAQKLLDSIRYMSDIRNFPVPKPNSVMMEMTTLKEWVKWYAKQTEWNGTDGTETEVMKVLDSLYHDLQILTERVESGFEKLLTALDRKDIKVKLLVGQIEGLQEQIKVMEQQAKEREGKAPTPTGTMGKAQPPTPPNQTGDDDSDDQGSPSSSSTPPVAAPVISLGLSRKNRS